MHCMLDALPTFDKQLSRSWQVTAWQIAFKEKKGAKKIRPGGLWVKSFTNMVCTDR